MEHELLIEVSHLSRHFSTNQMSDQSAYITAVDDISFNLKRGEILGFLGPNGAGKSTTMQMLTGNLAPSHGSIKIGGVDLMDRPIEAKAMMGYLPDTPPLYKELCVDEYLSYCARLNQIPKAGLQQAIDTTKERCGLMDHGQRIINNLSKGYQQRVGIAQAIIHSPDIVILDEPTVGLDPIQMIAIRKLIKELGKTHSVMLSSHILPEIQAICDNVQIINQGQLVFSASIDQLNQHMQTYSIRMSCQYSVDIQLIAALEEVKSVEQLKSNDSQGDSIRIHCFQNNPSHKDSLQFKSQQQSAVSELAQQLVSMAEQQAWGLYEIYAEKRSLEDIFMSLTCIDSGAGKQDLKQGDLLD
ncbi:MAG: ABC transporter ATP-binding protein [gamma proteobacterium symbiont of Taylorina sp.]|nr:ABC transporter ATP-binding protein [gamma proteobacterium symbiont of Taylorina sp.]